MGKRLKSCKLLSSLIKPEIYCKIEAIFSLEVAIFMVCGLDALSVLVFLALIVLASFWVIDGKFLLELLRIIRK